MKTKKLLQVYAVMCVGHNVCDDDVIKLTTYKVRQEARNKAKSLDVYHVQCGCGPHRIVTLREVKRKDVQR